MATNLTDRQRFALRESLCDALSECSDGWTGTAWDAEYVSYLRKAIAARKGLRTSTVLWKQIAGLVELLGEWPVGYRGEGGWEKLELSTKEQA